MKYELKKLLSNRFAILLCVGLFFANAFFFYQHAVDNSEGYSQMQVKEKYEQEIDLAEEISELEERKLLAADIEDSVDDRLITGDIYSELALDREVSRQIAEVDGYDQFLQDKVAEIRARLNSGFLGADEGYAYRAQEEVAEKYQALRGLHLEPTFSGHAEVLTTWELTDLFLVIWILIGGLLLFSDDRHSGILLLLRPTVRGKGVLYFRKLASLLIFSSAALLLLYATNLLICAGLFGFENLSLPIQNIPGFLACPIPYTVFGFLLRAAFEKLLWVWAVSALVAFFCTCTNSPVGATALCMGAGLVSVFLGSQRNLWLQNLSLFQQRAVSERYQACMMLNLFGKPITEVTAFLLISAGLFAGSVAAGFVCFSKRDTVISTRRRMQGLPIGNHTRLLCHESYKLFVAQKGILLLAALCLVQWGICRSTDLPVYDSEYYLAQYSQVLNGAVSDEKTAFLSEETQRFEEIQASIDYYNAHSSDENVADLLTEDLRMEQRAEPSFQIAKLQYESLSSGQSYVHPTGYRYLFGKQGVAGDLKSLLFLEAFLILSICGVFAREKETSVAVLQTTIGATQRLFRRKVFLSLILAVALTVISFLPQIILVAQRYGLPELTAQANSLPIFSGLSAFWRIWHIFLLSWGIRLAVAAGSTGIVLFFSKKTGTLTITLLCSIAVLIIPVAIALAVY